MQCPDGAVTDPSGGVRRFSLTALTSEPWRNSGGVTRTVAVGGQTDADGWAWRISIADIARDGPFSIFPGRDRHLALIDGNGIALRGDTAIRLADVGAVASFRGDDAYDASLIDGPARVWNLMTERRSTFGSIQKRTGSIERLMQPGALVSCVYVIAAVYRLQMPDRDHVDLHTGDGVVFERFIDATRLSSADANAAVLVTQVALRPTPIRARR